MWPLLASAIAVVLERLVCINILPSIQTQATRFPIYQESLCLIMASKGYPTRESSENFPGIAQ